jgi:hypothetical protein
MLVRKLWRTAAFDWMPPNVVAEGLGKLAAGRTPLTPVANGKPVAFVRTKAVGVPNAGVTNVGDVARTFAPVPIVVVAPLPPRATANVPVAMLEALVVSVVAEAASPVMSPAAG